jgi:hypothetical protein
MKRLSSLAVMNKQLMCIWKPLQLVREYLLPHPLSKQ